MTVLTTPPLSKMTRGSPEYFRLLERYLEQLQRQIGKTVNEVEEAKVGGLASAKTYFLGQPGFHDWTAQDDGSGTFTAGDPTRDLVGVIYNKSGTEVARQTLRGTLTSSAGTVAVTEVSSSISDTDLVSTIAYAVVDDATNAPRADITTTFVDGSSRTDSVSWLGRDISSASSIPATGGGK